MHRAINIKNGKWAESEICKTGNVPNEEKMFGCTNFDSRLKSPEKFLDFLKQNSRYLRFIDFSEI